MTPSLSWLIVGYGSIGSRHARVLESLGCDVSVVSRRPHVHARSFTSLATALSARRYEDVILANETSQHAAALCALEAHGFRGTVFVENRSVNSGRSSASRNRCARCQRPPRSCIATIRKRPRKIAPEPIVY